METCRRGITSLAWAPQNAPARQSIAKFFQIFRHESILVYESKTDKGTRHHGDFAMRQLLAKVGLLLLCCCLLTSRTQACSCLGPLTVESSLERNDYALKARVIDEVFPLGPVDESNQFIPRYYRAFVFRMYNGCRIRRRILIRTAANSALCGVDLTPGTTYLLFGSMDIEHLERFRNPQMVLSVNGCDLQAPWRSLDRDQVLSLRSLATGACFDPLPRLCDLNECPFRRNQLCSNGQTPHGLCVYHEHYGFCEWEQDPCPSCRSDFECQGGEFCSKGACRSVGTCNDDADCYNPANTVPGSIEVQCILERSCENQVCRAECCTNVFNCLIAPCDTLSFEYSSCSDSYCGGCNAYPFDMAGNSLTDF